MKSEEGKGKFDFENFRDIVFLQEKQYLTDYNVEDLDFKKGLPKGIFNKKYPGMGATYCEFHAERPSILVFPFRRLAFEKAETYKNRNTFFVGTDPNNKSTSKYQIKDWFLRNKTENPKFSVVADSIRKLVEALQEAGCDPYKEFFLVLDEVELLQMQSGFRSILPLCFDYFKKFEKKCLVSATLLDFSDKTLRNLPKYDLEVFTSKTDELGINYTRDKEELQIRVFKINPHWGVANQLVEYFKKNGSSETKFFIGLNSLDGISEMIEIFEKAKINDLVSVHVSATSKERFLKKYNILEIENGMLPTRINLTSCVNFSGIDLKENFHSIAISLQGKVHHAFSFENLIQFFGRSRFQGKKHPYTFAVSTKNRISYEKPKVPFVRRKKQLNGLIDYVNSEIEEKKDRNDLISALSETKSSLIYLDIEGMPAVNWLLEDLENYEIEKVNDYKKNGKGLNSKLKERYHQKVTDYSNSFFPIRPTKRDDEEKELEQLDKFLDNLDEDYESIDLVDRFLDEKSLQTKKVAAYWYLFGRTFLLDEKNCKELATHFSSLNKPYMVTSVVVEGLRFYTRHSSSFEELVEVLIRERNNKKNLASSEVLEILENIDGAQQHFPSIFGIGNKSEYASLFMEQFFGVSKIGGSRPKFKINEKDLNKPYLVRKFTKLENQLNQVSKIPKGDGIDFGKIRPENLIDTIF